MSKTTQRAREAEEKALETFKQELLDLCLRHKFGVTAKLYSSVDSIRAMIDFPRISENDIRAVSGVGDSITPKTDANGSIHTD